MTDGPFTESKELIAGFTLIDVRSKDEAVAWARRWPAIDADAEIEVRSTFLNRKISRGEPGAVTTSANAGDPS